MGERHGQQQASDHGRAVNDGVSALGNNGVEPLSGHSSGHADQRDHQAPPAQHYGAHTQGRQQSDDHIQHDPPGGEISPNMGRRSNRQIHLFAASLNIFLPRRNFSTRGSLPGQVKAQQPHSMQSIRFKRSS